MGTGVHTVIYPQNELISDVAAGVFVAQTTDACLVPLPGEWREGARITPHWRRDSEASWAEFAQQAQRFVDCFVCLCVLHHVGGTLTRPFYDMCAEGPKDTSPADALHVSYIPTTARYVTEMETASSTTTTATITPSGSSS